MTNGFDCVTILGNCNASGEVLEVLASNGVKFLASRSAGYNNIDLVKAKELGIRVSNATYSPNSVSEFTVMLFLMLNRKAKSILNRQAAHDYSLPGKIGIEARNQVVGVIGSGRIGLSTIKNLSGFGCEIVVYDVFENDEVKKYAKYVSLDELFASATVIILHAPLLDSTREIINKNNINKMRDGVTIINSSRGELVNTQDLIDGLDSGKIGAAGLDVLAQEAGYFHVDHRINGLNQREIAILEQKQNVILTSHIAFYTDQAVLDMVECALTSLVSFKNTGSSNLEVTA